MIEVVTINGFRRLIRIDMIASVHELVDKRSNTVIVMTNGETIFAANKYDDILTIIGIYEGGQLNDNQ